MSFLINRNPSGRIICLHALLRYLYQRFREKPFTLNDMKFDDKSRHSILQTCTLLVKLPSISNPVCPYLENPLSAAKCYLTQSIQEDTQKSKSVSDAFNTLEGLGFINRTDKGGVITKEGIAFILNDYTSSSTLNELKKGLLKYGPFVGLLYEISRSKYPTTKRSNVSLGYPVTDEKVMNGGQVVILSSGSQQDTITRTRSVMFIWAITGGFLLPEGTTKLKDKKKCHVEMLPYIKKKKWTINNFKVIQNDIFKNKILVERPLSYNAMTKSTKALRERNQEDVRSLTLKFEPIIKNRRFAIIYSLAKKSEKNGNLNYRKLIQELIKYPELFVVDKKAFDKVMDRELKIANVAGIPFERKGDLLIPMTNLNIIHLKLGAPNPLIKTLDQILEKI